MRQRSGMAALAEEEPVWEYCRCLDDLLTDLLTDMNRLLEVSG